MVKISRADKAFKPIVDVKCSNCGHKLEEQVLLSPNILCHVFYKICPECGQEVKWDARSGEGYKRTWAL